MNEDTVKRIGNIIDGTAEKDAIHIAVFPAIASTKLHAGMSVKLEGNHAVPITHTSRIGIVDPFLHEPVYEGQRCFIFLNPGSITSLRHEWTHPALEGIQPQDSKTDTKSEAEQWMRQFAEAIGLSYDRTMIAIANSLAYEDYHTFDYDTPNICYDQREKMWEQYAILTGAAVEDKNRTVFSCSC